MNVERFRSPVLIAGVLVFLGALVLYLITVAPTLSFGWRGYGTDGGELLAAANGWGVPHPPGYPTYTVLLKVFASIFAVGDYAFRGNLMSAFLGSTAALLIYATGYRVARALSPGSSELLAAAAAALGAAVVAVSPLFWSQSVITEVYALNAAFTAALLYLAARVSLAPAPGPVPNNKAATGEPAENTLRRDLALYGLMLGLGLGNHLTLLAIAVATLYWMIASRGWRTLLTPWLIGPAALGAAVYIYLPIASSGGPAINWGNATGPGGLAWMMSGRPYQDYLFGTPVAGLPDRLMTWLEFIFIQFNPLGIFVGLVGLWNLKASMRPLAIALIAIFALVSTYTISYNAFDFQVFMLPAFMAFGLAIGIGTFWLASDWLPRAIDAAPFSKKTRADVLSYNPIFFLVTLAFVLMPVIGVVLNFSGQDLSDDRSGIEHGESLLNRLQSDSLVFTVSDEDAFSLWYLTLLEQQERNVAVIVSPLLQFEWYAKNLKDTYGDRIPDGLTQDIDTDVAAIAELNFESRQIYSTYESSGLVESFQLIQAGSIYLIAPKIAPQ
jgi:hypothetical protein